MDFPTDMLYKEMQQLCSIKLKVVGGFSEIHTAVLHLPTGFCINV